MLQKSKYSIGENVLVFPDEFSRGNEFSFDICKITNISSHINNFYNSLEYELELTTDYFFVECELAKLTKCLQYITNKFNVTKE